MFSYTRSLMAAGLALLAMICAGLWLQNRTMVLNELTDAGRNLQMQITGSEACPVMIADYSKRLETLNSDTEKITCKFVGKDFEAPMLVRAIVEAASLSGMEMTNASKQGKKTKVYYNEPHSELALAAFWLGRFATLAFIIVGVCFIAM